MSGKGGWRRPAAVTRDAIDANWARTFGPLTVDQAGTYTVLRCGQCRATRLVRETESDNGCPACGAALYDRAFG